MAGDASRDSAPGDRQELIHKAFVKALAAIAAAGGRHEA